MDAAADPPPPAPPRFTDEEAVRAFNAALPAGLKLMGADCTAASNADRSITVAYELDERFTNVGGFVCGGYLANALDQTACYAMTFLTGDPAPTLEIKVSFVEALRPGRFTVTGRVVKAGRTFGFVEAEARDGGGRLLATASATVQQIALGRLKDARRAADAPAG